jgi:hypothetical protein
VVPPEVNLSLNARNLALAYNSGYTNIVCTCPTSYANLKECIGALNDEKTRAVINNVLKAVNYEYKGGVTVYHAAEVLYAMKESLIERATLSLTKSLEDHGSILRYWMRSVRSFLARYWTILNDRYAVEWVFRTSLPRATTQNR